jgi:hypothetical protein
MEKLTPEEEALKTGVQVAGGVAAGVLTGLQNAAAPQFQPRHIMGTANTVAKASNAATKSFHQHHKVGAALAAGASAVIGHGTVATLAAAGAAVVVAVAPVVLGVAVFGGATFGVHKLIQHFTKAPPGSPDGPPAPEQAR